MSRYYRRHHHLRWLGHCWPNHLIVRKVVEKAVGLATIPVGSIRLLHQNHVSQSAGGNPTMRLPVRSLSSSPQRLWSVLCSESRSLSLMDHIRNEVIRQGTKVIAMP